MELNAGTYWLTRDTDIDGTLENAVDIWEARPILIELVGTDGYCWLSEQEDVEPFVCRLSLNHAQSRFGTLPETTRECIRVVTG